MAPSLPSTRPYGHRSRPSGWLLDGCLLAAAVLAGSCPIGIAAEPPGDRAGGLLPAGESPPSGLTREELLRTWDLDGDGSITRTEADVARGRMRQQRLEMQLGAGIDPITGEPRDPRAQTGDESPAPGDKPAYRLPDEPPPPARRREGPPGTRPPVLEPPRPGARGAMPAARPPGRAGATRPGPQAGPAAPPARELSGRASWLPPRSQGTPAGGGRPGATPGGQSGPWSALRGAGPRGSRTAPALPGSGGLLPTGRQPFRTGSILIPGAPPTARVGPSPAPLAPPVIPRPRITAEEIGGDLP